MRESDNDYLNNENPTNPKIGLSDDKVKTVYLICASIMYLDGKKHMHQPRNVDLGFVVCGRRHHNCFITSFILGGQEDVEEKISTEKWKIVQGFITSDDRFVDRKEGGKIAFEAGQTKRLHQCLFSEDLY